MDPILNQFWWDGNTGIPHEFPGEIPVASGFGMYAIATLEMWLTPFFFFFSCYNPSYEWTKSTYPTSNWGYNRRVSQPKDSHLGGDLVSALLRPADACVAGHGDGGWGHTPNDANVQRMFPYWNGLKLGYSYFIWRQSQEIFGECLTE